MRWKLEAILASNLEPLPRDWFPPLAALFDFTCTLASKTFLSLHRLVSPSLSSIDFIHPLFIHHPIFRRLSNHRPENLPPLRRPRKVSISYYIRITSNRRPFSHCALKSWPRSLQNTARGPYRVNDRRTAHLRPLLYYSTPVVMNSSSLFYLPISPAVGYNCMLT